MGRGDVSDTVQAGGQSALDGPLSAPIPTKQPRGKAGKKGLTAARKSVSPPQRQPPQAVQMMELAAQHRAELFSFAGDSFAAVDINNRRATLRIESTEFAKLLRCWLYEATQTTASAQAVTEAQATLAARARYSESEQPVYLRTGKAGDALYLDLGTSTGQAIEVTPEGWRVIPLPPVHFLRPAGMQPLPIPTRGGQLAELFAFINPPEDCRPLLLAWLMFALSPDGPFPLLAVHGEQGSGKTTGCRMLRALVDPHSAGLRSVPRDDRNLMISTRHGWLLSFDNLSSLPPWLSDLLCGIATGTATAARSLYTDDGEALFQAKRPILLNGIEEVATRADLLDRCLVVSFQPIPEEQRRSEAELWAAFELARPRIFGALLDALVCALRQLPQVKLPRSPRMVDFAKWGTAAESALGLPASGFINAYFQNIRAACDLPIEASAIAGPLQALLRQQGQNLQSWTGTATELLKELRAIADEEVKRQSNWPKNAQQLSGELKRLAPNFRQKGVHIEHGRNATAKRTRVITVRGEPC